MSLITPKPKSLIPVVYGVRKIEDLVLKTKAQAPWIDVLTGQPYSDLLARGITSNIPHFTASGTIPLVAVAVLLAAQYKPKLLGATRLRVPPEDVMNALALDDEMLKALEAQGLDPRVLLQQKQLELK